MSNPRKEGTNCSCSPTDSFIWKYAMRQDLVLCFLLDKSSENTYSSINGERPPLIVFLLYSVSKLVIKLLAFLVLRDAETINVFCWQSWHLALTWMHSSLVLVLYLNRLNSTYPFHYYNALIPSSCRCSLFGTNWITVFKSLLVPQLCHLPILLSALGCESTGGWDIIH